MVWILLEDDKEKIPFWNAKEIKDKLIGDMGFNSKGLSINSNGNLLYKSATVTFKNSYILIYFNNKNLKDPKKRINNITAIAWIYHYLKLLD